MSAVSHGLDFADLGLDQAVNGFVTPENHAHSDATRNSMHVPFAESNFDGNPLDACNGPDGIAETSADDPGFQGKAAHA